MATPAFPVHPSIVTPASAHPQLDPEVQAFLDHHEEAPARESADTAVTRFRPRGSEAAALPVLLYLYAPVEADLPRTAAMQELADRSGAAILLQVLSGATLADVERGVVNTLDCLSLGGSAEGLDPTRLALGGDGVGALVAIAFASRAAANRFHLALLVLATPLLSLPTAGKANSWLSQARADAQTHQAETWIGADGWPRDYPRDRLSRLPATLILTADADPFRDGAEDVARRLMAADLEVLASRAIGTIHDYSWLPPSLGSAASVAAQRLIAAALRDHLFPITNPEIVPC